MPHTLIPHDFDLSNQADVVDFECGDEPWEASVADWIKGQGVARSIERGTQVWLYRLQDGTLVGYSSLGKTRWAMAHGSASGMLNIARYETLSIIPSIAIQTRFQGRPSGVPREEKFSSQIMSDVLTKAYAHETTYVVLEVHERNERAITLYAKYGFRPIATIRKTFGGDHHCYLRMAMRQR